MICCCSSLAGMDMVCMGITSLNLVFLVVLVRHIYKPESTGCTRFLSQRKGAYGRRVWSPIR
ncbi:uncharacterized protein BDV17DRAFT_142012 [Aspergillus undulatus]|uniref:uncharacterized protein n=1 Tax=Aspergillus undulatus TaxID=1810928 RepID=UPI003CCE53B4